jgi:hypothetical protein
VDGFPRIARLTAIIARTALGKVPTEDGGLTATGAALTRVGRVPTRLLKRKFPQSRQTRRARAEAQSRSLAARRQPGELLKEVVRDSREVRLR